MERRRVCSGQLSVWVQVRWLHFCPQNPSLVEVLPVQGNNASLAYIYANEGDIYGNGSSAYSYVTVLDVRRQQIVDRIQVQPRPVHIYTIQQTQQVWSHSDATGNFSIISISRAGSLNSTVPVSLYPKPCLIGFRTELAWLARIINPAPCMTTVT